MHAFNQSLRYDQRMHAADIRGSIAYAKALTRVGILTAEEEAKLVEGLQAVEREWENGQVRYSGFSFALPLSESGISNSSRLALVCTCTRRRRHPHCQ